MVIEPPSRHPLDWWEHQHSLEENMVLGVRSNTGLWIHCETRHKDHPKPQHMQQHHWRSEPGIFSMLKMCQLKQTFLNEKALPLKLGGCKRGDVWQSGKVSTVSFCVSFGMRDFPTKLCLVITMSWWEWHAPFASCRTDCGKTREFSIQKECTCKSNEWTQAHGYASMIQIYANTCICMRHMYIWIYSGYPASFGVPFSKAVVKKYIHPAHFKTSYLAAAFMKSQGVETRLPTQYI